MEILPLSMKRIIFKHKIRTRCKKPKYKQSDTIEITKRRYVDHLQIQNNASNTDIISGIHIWLIQTYFSIVKMLPDCTYENFISAIFAITSGNYNAVDQSLLSGLLSQESSVYLMQNPELQNPTTSKYL